VGIAAGAAVWVRRMHPRNKIHQLRVQLPKKHAGGFVVRHRLQLSWPHARHAALRDDRPSAWLVGSIADMTLPISLHSAMKLPLRLASMRYASIHGR
jgi:hypothetical protein